MFLILTAYVFLQDKYNRRVQTKTAPDVQHFRRLKTIN